METSFGPNNFFVKKESPKKFYCSKGHQWQRTDGLADTVSFCLDGKNFGPPICMYCIAVFAEENFGIVGEIPQNVTVENNKYDLVDAIP